MAGKREVAFMKWLTSLALHLACLVAIAPTAHAAEAQKYAVVSLIGESLTITTFQPTTGSRLDTNIKETFVMPDSQIDRAALLAAEGAIKKVDPAATVVLLEVAALREMAEQRRLLDGEQFVAPQDLGLALKDAAATHLFLITKHRAEAALQAQRSKLGSGPLQGLGFYVDNQKRTRRSDTNESGQGFLAPYAYFKVSLIDLASSKLIKQHVVTATTTLSAARNANGIDAWGVLTTAQKIKMLVNFIQREMPVAAEKVMAP
jgi:hypothetical protein